MTDYWRISNQVLKLKYMDMREQPSVGQKSVQTRLGHSQMSAMPNNSLDTTINIGKIGFKVHRTAAPLTRYDVSTRFLVNTVPNFCSPTDRLIISCLHYLSERSRSLIAAALVGSLLLLSACDRQSQLDDSVAQLKLQTLTGDLLTLKEASGPVLVNFWSTSCAICVHEMPDMVDLYEEYAGKGFELVAVAMQYDPPNQVLELANRQSLPFPVALDLKGEAVAAFGSVKGTPTSYLLGPDGELVRRYIGAIDFDSLRSELDQLLDLS